MFVTLIVATMILVIMDLTMWRYGSNFLNLDDEKLAKKSYMTSISGRLPIMFAVLCALMFVMIDSYKSIYLRVALLIVMLLAYFVFMFKDLKGNP